MPLAARRFLRKMRGGAQAHLVEAEDGRCYVVKFLNNPQHRRILTNEFIAAVFLRYLQIAVPEAAIIEFSRDFLLANPEVHIQLSSRRLAVEPGWHFGSLYPGHPDRTAVYDFLPDSILGQVGNLSEFLGMLVFDKWTANADSRQSIFLRARLRDWVPSSGEHPLRVGFAALMIDHGYLFDGPHWGFCDSPLQGLYFRPLVYQNVRSLDDFQPWLNQVMNFPEEVVDQAVRQIPPAWVEGDEEALQRLLEQLLARRKQVPHLLADCRKGRTNPFPHWP